MPKLWIALVTSTILFFAVPLKAQVRAAVPATEPELTRWKALIDRSDALHGNGLRDNAREVLERALDIAKGFEEERRYEAITLRKIGGLYLENGEYHQAGPILTRALSLLEHSGSGDDPQIPSCWYALAVYYRNLGDYPSAESAFGHAVSTSQKNGDPGNEATALFGLGVLYEETARYGQSVSVLSRSLRIFQSQPEPDPDRISETLTNLAIAYVHQGKFQEGEPLLRRAIRIADRGLGSGSLSAASAEHVLASLENVRGDPRTAEKRLRRVLAVFESAKGLGHRDVAAVLLDLAETLVVQGRGREAEGFAIRARESRKERWGKNT